MGMRPINGKVRDDRLARLDEVERFFASLDGAPEDYSRARRFAITKLGKREGGRFVEEYLRRDSAEAESASLPHTAVEGPPPRRILVRPRGVESRFKASTLAALVRETFPPREQLLAGILPSAGAGVLGAQKAAGKTLLSAALALDIAKGSPEFLGRRHPTGPVIYITLEHSREEFLCDVLMPLLGADFERRPAWMEDFHLIAVDSDESPALLPHEDRFSWLEGVIAEVRPIFAVLDTWVEFRPPRKGNDLYADDKLHAERVRAIGRAHRCFILLLHHIGKGARGGDPATDLIATTGLPAGLNVVLGLQRAFRSSRATLAVKGNAVAEARLALHWDDTSLRFSPGEGTRGGRPSAKKNVALDWLRERLASGPVLATNLKSESAAICSWRWLVECKAQLGIKTIGAGRTASWKLPGANA